MIAFDVVRDVIFVWPTGSRDMASAISDREK